jgi:hypothetical protein
MSKGNKNRRNRDRNKDRYKNRPHMRQGQEWTEEKEIGGKGSRKG